MPKNAKRQLNGLKRIQALLALGFILVLASHAAASLEIAGNNVFSDIYGHAVAAVSGSTVTWNPVRSTGYGPEPGTTALPLDGVHDDSTFFNWHGKYVDGAGYYHLGNRYYDPTSGTFISCDPLGHAASMDLYSYASGDPVNYFDPDGMVATQFGNSAKQDTAYGYDTVNNAGVGVVQGFENILGGLDTFGQSGFQSIDPSYSEMGQAAARLNSA